MARTPRAQGRDLTRLSIHRAIWYLAPPMILEMGVQNLAQILDTYWIGQLGSAALAAVTISITIRWVLNSLANGLGIGGMAVVARRIGAKDPAAAEHAVWQTILLGVSMSLILSVTGMILARPLLVLLGADAEVLPLGLAYLRISFAGIFTLILVFAINAMLRGAGEAGMAMRVLFLTTGVTVVLEPILIRGWGRLPALGVAGSALAFVLGFGAGLALQLGILLSGRARIRIDLHNLRPDLPLMGRIIRISLPSTIQMTLRSSSRLIIVALVGAFGTYATAGYGVANRMLLIALIPCFGLGNAASTLVGQNLGARQPGRAERSAWWVSAYAAGYMAVAALFLTIFAPSLIAIFDATPEVVAIGTECVHVVAWSMIASAGGVVLARGFDGAGNTVPAMAINLLTLWGMELPIAYGLSQWLGFGVTGVWWGRAVANLANGLLFAIWFRRGKWKEREV
ncbi:MAG: MATE family efflux transporter [Anaerolineae bacterium]